MKILKLIYLTSLCLLLQLVAFGQGWERLYPNISQQTGSDIRKIIPAPGGGFLMLVADENGATVNFDFSIVKVSETGSVLSVRHFDFGSDESAQDFIALSDGGYAVFYQTYLPHSVLQSYLVKLDDQLNVVFQQEVLPGQPLSNNGARKILENQQHIWVYGTLGTANFQAGYNLDGTPSSYHVWLNNGSSFRTATVAPDGSVVAITDHFGGGANFGVVNVSRFDTAGVVAWTTTLTQPSQFYIAGDVTAAPDGGFLVSGSKNSQGVLIKFSDAGQNLWEKVFPIAPPATLDFTAITTILPTADGTAYWAFSTSDSYIPQIEALRLDLQGNLLWTKKFGANFTYNLVRSAIALPDGVIAGGYNGATGLTNIIPYLFRTDNTGNTNQSGVSGKVQVDFDGDCIADVDSLSYGRVVRAWQNGQLINQGSVGEHGDYFISLDPGAYKIAVLKPNPITHFCPDTIPVTVLAQDTVKNADFTEYYHPEPVDSVYGSIFEDLDGDCVHDAFESGHSGWTVVLQLNAPAPISHTYTTVTDANGHFVFPNLSADGFNNDAGGVISITPPSGDGLTCIITCPQALLVKFDGGHSFQSNIGMHCDSLSNCVVIDVDMSIISLRPCHTSGYHINYCNNSSQIANNVYLVVTIDSSLNVFTAGTTWTHLSGNQYSYNVGTLQPEQCGDVMLYVSVPCDDPVGKTYCSEVHAYPDTSCANKSPNWDGSQIEVKAKCVGDQVQFTITNVGNLDMTQQQDYIVIEDNVLLTQPPNHFMLQSGGSMTVPYPTNGNYLRMEAQQTPGAPTLKMPAAWVEGCATGANNTSLGFVNQYPLGDQDPWLDVCCTQSNNSYDPNDKTGFPIGVKSEHFINRNTDIEYQIRFQNTGTAPAEYIEVRDTIPVQFLDPKTVRPGASSHYYQWDMQGNGVVVFKFPNIYLPDSSKGDASHGFVNFQVAQRNNLPLGTKIYNKADIYFDHNPDVVTNQTFHTIGKDYLLAESNPPALPNVRVTLAPNPAQDRVSVEVAGLTQTAPLRFVVFTSVGTMVSDQPFSGTQMWYEAGTLPKGVYFYEIRQGNALVANGKLIKM